MSPQDQAAIELAAHVVERCKALGVDEVCATVSEGTSVQISRRDGNVEQATEASSRRLGVSLMVDGRYSSHGTSDLRPEALRVFLARAMAATRVLEPDPDRALPDISLCGRGATDAQLDTFDPSYPAWSADDRAALAERCEQAFLARRGDDFVSATVWVSDGHGRTAQVTSHGFSDVSGGASYSVGGTVTLSEPGGRRPEGYGSYGARYRSDLPSVDAIAEEAYLRAREAIGSGPIASGRYPMILLNRFTGRILGTLSDPLSGYSIHQGKSCLADKLGARIGSELLSIEDDPTIARGLGSGPWDDDLLVARPRSIVERGVLRSHYLDVYHARKLGLPPTTGSRSNWVLPVGTQSWQELARGYDKAILVTGFLGGNAHGLTGDFSFGIRGKLLERGEPTASLSEMNVTGNTLQIFHQLAALGNDPWTWSSTRSPTLVFEDVQFSGV
jgi:PmbA protein